MVRMSDLVRGIVREAPVPTPPRSPAEPSEGVQSTPPVSIANSELPVPVVRVEPPPPRHPVEPSEPSAPLFGELQQFLLDARARISGEGFVWTRLESLVDRAATSLRVSPDLFWVANHPVAPPGVDYVAFHQARVCVLALRLGVDLGYDAARLVPLGEAAALFDVGLWQLPAALVERADSLSDRDLAAYRSHPTLSAEIVLVAPAPAHRRHDPRPPRARARAGLSPCPAGRRHRSRREDHRPRRHVRGAHGAAIVPAAAATARGDP